MEALETEVRKTRMEMPSIDRFAGMMYMPSRFGYQRQNAPAYRIENGILICMPKPQMDNIPSLGDTFSHSDPMGGLQDRFRYDEQRDSNGDFHINYETLISRQKNGKMRDSVLSNFHIPIDKRPL